MEIPKCIIVFPRIEDMMSQSSSQLESIFFVSSSLTKAAPDSYDAVLNTKQSTRTTSLPLLVAKVILSNLAFSDLQLSKINNLSLARLVG